MINMDSGGGTLPFTGAGAAVQLAVGLVLTAVGLVLRAVGREPKHARSRG